MRDLSQNSNIRSLEQTRPSSNIRNTVFFGLIVVLSIFLGLGVWSATAPLAKAVAAFATLTVKGEKKQVQHLEGGIVEAINVTEGQMVSEGDPLMALNPLQASASVARHHALLDQALALETRLESELRGDRVITLNGQILERLQIDESVLEILAAEERNFFARQETLDGTISILKQRMEQLNSEIKGLSIQRSSRLEQLAILKDELVGLRELHSKGFYPKSKLLAGERAIVELRGATGNDLALIARAKSSLGEAENQIVNVKQRFRESVSQELRDVQTEITDLKKRLLVAKDILKRIVVKAPRSGIVQGIKFHTIGGVVKPGDILMEIAPQDEELLARAQVLPADIDNVVVGQRAEVRLTALNTRTTPGIYGYVKSVSGDVLLDSRNNTPYYLTRIEIPLSERKKLGDVKLTAGMQADVLIQTGERTALSYLLKPLTDAFARGLNED
tara:strand:- start:9933 stop:11273 length:1341 start_codon:yes stop_codon:yes gene_type:complete